MANKHHKYDGDSLGAASIIAILSSLSSVSIKQSLAITGAINRYGDILPVNGVNEKILGFFLLCCANGLTGEQGVVIPKENEIDLRLRDDVVEAVRKGMFHIYTVETVNEALEIMTGVPAEKIYDLAGKTLEKMNTKTLDIKITIDNLDKKIEMADHIVKWANQGLKKKNEKSGISLRKLIQKLAKGVGYENQSK